ncbi:MAG: phenylalanine--tRNA ligase subunit beta [Candidatus Nanohaloarchaea archaeon]
MPHIQINKHEFDELVGAKVTEKTLNEEASFLGVHWNHVNKEKWDIEVYPNRPDLLCVEGLARAYRGYFKQETGLEEYEVSEGSLKLKKSESVEDVRPHIACAVVRNLELDERMINGLIQLQEKLHVSYGRQRDKLAIGLHDMSEISPPFTYKAVAPEKVSFTPLEYDKDINLGEILNQHEKGQKYAWILDDEDRYPVIVDSNDRVLSFPPIINNQLTEVEDDTEDIFIDVTGKDKQTVRKALNIIVAALGERGGDIEKVEVDGEELPDMTPEEFELDVDYVNQVSGLDLSPKEVKERLEKMRYGVKMKKGFKVQVPAYRTDVMHQYDLIEDIVIAHGYNNIDPQLPEVDQDGGLTEITRLADELRDVMLRAGVLEAKTYVLTKEEYLFQKMEIERSNYQITLENPMTEEYSTVRSWLTPSLFQVLQENKHNTYPQEFFEVEDIAKKSGNYTGAENRKKMAYIVAGEVDYNQARRKLQALERDLDLDLTLKKASRKFHKPSRSAEIYVEDERIGFIGEYSEKVADNWGIDQRITGFEIDVEKLKEEF